MLFVRLEGKEYIPFLRQDSIKLKDAKFNTLELHEEGCPEVLVKDLDAELDEAGESWFKCGYYALRVLLERKIAENAKLKIRVMSGEFELDECETKQGAVA
jgi:hypothetical protein